MASTTSAAVPIRDAAKTVKAFVDAVTDARVNGVDKLGHRAETHRAWAFACADSLVELTEQDRWNLADVFRHDSVYQSALDPTKLSCTPDGRRRHVHLARVAIGHGPLPAPLPTQIVGSTCGDPDLFLYDVRHAFPRARVACVLEQDAHEPTLRYVAEIASEGLQKTTRVGGTDAEPIYGCHSFDAQTGRRSTPIVVMREAAWKTHLHDPHRIVVLCGVSDRFADMILGLVSQGGVRCAVGLVNGCDTAHRHPRQFTSSMKTYLTSRDTSA